MLDQIEPTAPNAHDANAKRWVPYLVEYDLKSFFKEFAPKAVNLHRLVNAVRRARVSTMQELAAMSAAQIRELNDLTAAEQDFVLDMQNLYNITNGLSRRSQIKYVGVGGAGCKAISQLHNTELERIAIHMDENALSGMDVTKALLIGNSHLQEQSAGNTSSLVRQAVIDSHKEILDLLGDARIIVVVASLNDELGMGAAPEVCRIAHESCPVVISLVATPFDFESMQIKADAKRAHDTLLQEASCIVDVLSSKQDSENMDRARAYTMSDQAIWQAIRSFDAMLSYKNILGINTIDVVDLAVNAGQGYFSYGYASRDDGASEALRNAYDNANIKANLCHVHDGKPIGCDILLHFWVSEDFELNELDSAIEALQKRMHPESNFMYTIDIDTQIQDTFQVGLFALANFERKLREYPPEPDLIIDWEDEE